MIYINIIDLAPNHLLFLDWMENKYKTHFHVNVFSLKPHNRYFPNLQLIKQNQFLCKSFIKIIFEWRRPFEHSINPSIYNIIRWFAGPMGQTTRQPSVWCSKYYFFTKNLQNSLQKPFQFFFFNKITKMKIKSFECPKSIKNHEKQYLERQTLDRQVVCPFGPANQRIIL